MKEKGNSKVQQQTAGSLSSGTRSEEPIRKKDQERDNEVNGKSERYVTKRLVKRNYHPDGPGGGYDGL